MQDPPPLGRITKETHAIEVTLLRLNADCAQHIHVASGAMLREMEEILTLESDVGHWLEVLAGQPEFQQLRCAHQDFGLALYAAMSGLYRQAFSSLRSFIEVTVGSVYLSSFELKRRQWVSGKIDISWSTISSPEEGVYSKAYVSEFCSEVETEPNAMQSDLKATYRRCSEYIHGHVSTSLLLPDRILYEAGVLREWIDVAKRALLVILHCFMVRYYKDFNSDQMGEIESSLEDNFSHLVSVRKLLGLPVEGHS